MEEFVMEYKINKEIFPVIISEAIKYAMQKGVSMMSKTLGTSEDTRVHLPFCILPSEFPKQWFEYVYYLQPSINYILHKIAYSEDFIEDCLSSTLEADEFTRNLFNIYKSVINDNEQWSLGILRSDYFLNCDSSDEVDGIKQIENNTFSAGFCAVGSKLQDLYMYIFEKLGWTEHISKLPENKSGVEAAKGMILAWNEYGNTDAGIVFVVEEWTFNITDQRMLEEAICLENKDINVIRCTFKDLRTSLQVKDKKLFVKNMEVAVVYYRVGYLPKHYDEEDWKTRLLIEQSLAIKCPSIGLHLAGTKRIQLYLTKEGVLERFVSPDVADKLRNIFAGQYLLNTEESGKIISKAIENPERFVLKPEREGGGNNLYGLDMKDFLSNINSNQRNSYILMDRINPPKVANCILRHGSNEKFCHVTNELGIFGVILGKKDEIHENYSAGHILRSKPKDLDEGGVASGYGALDYPFFLH